MPMCAVNVTMHGGLCMNCVALLYILECAHSTLYVIYVVVRLMGPDVIGATAPISVSDNTMS